MRRIDVSTNCQKQLSGTLRCDDRVASAFNNCAANPPMVTVDHPTRLSTSVVFILEKQLVRR